MAVATGTGTTATTSQTTLPGVYTCSFTASRERAERIITPAATATVIEVDMDFCTVLELVRLAPAGSRASTIWWP